MGDLTPFLLNLQFSAHANWVMAYGHTNSPSFPFAEASKNFDSPFDLGFASMEDISAGSKSGSDSKTSPKSDWFTFFSLDLFATKSSETSFPVLILFLSVFKILNGKLPSGTNFKLVLEWFGRIWVHLLNKIRKLSFQKAFKFGWIVRVTSVRQLQYQRCTYFLFIF